MPSLPALRSRNYRLFFAGQLVSLTGTWMQQIAMVWLAYRLTDSAAMLGLVGFASQIPILLFSTVAGVWNDRVDRRRLLLWTQTAALTQALLLAILTFFGSIQADWLVALAFVLGCINAVDLPARQAFVAQLVTDKADLANAIGLNSFLMNGTRFVGPALAGLLVATWGEAFCFLLNALSYGAVLLALRAIRVAPKTDKPTRESTWSSLKSGFQYAHTHEAIRRALWLVAGFGLFVTPYTILMPLFAREIFAGAADTYGFLVASAGAGSLCAALWLTFRAGRTATTTQGLETLVARAALGGGIVLAGFALTPGIILAYPLLMLLGFCVVLTVAGSNTLISISVSDTYRGRVMSIFSTAFLGIAPLGSLAVGAIAEAVGVRNTLLGCAVLTLLLSVRHTWQLRQQKPAHQ
ncbi:MFS transporter [Rhodocyclaceae bacterium]